MMFTHFYFTQPVNRLQNFSFRRKITLLSVVQSINIIKKKTKQNHFLQQKASEHLQFPLHFQNLLTVPLQSNILASVAFIGYKNGKHFEFLYWRQLVLFCNIDRQTNQFKFFWHTDAYYYDHSAEIIIEAEK